MKHDFICYMNEYGLVTEREATAKLWQSNGTTVWVMRPDYELGDVELPPAPVAQPVWVQDTFHWHDPPAHHVQTMGRGLRPIKGKAPPLIIDMARREPIEPQPVGSDPPPVIRTHLRLPPGARENDFVNHDTLADCPPAPGGVNFKFNSGEW